ncbi:hypothetical protein TNIN_50151 [Trichonephila inaurata madagascariensis]|uniref:Uncharacterized protein n=1 Tax=Trichonephila inaurata madagascariensis TaxID=2747483 RepID=A0A8X6X6V7_9ARAC|nr:hypothetical protein TNIN_50151 [Trichonephila inaurata madagascariensis]
MQRKLLTNLPGESSFREDLWVKEWSSRPLPQLPEEHDRPNLMANIFLAYPPSWYHLDLKRKNPPYTDFR